MGNETNPHRNIKVTLEAAQKSLDTTENTLRNVDKSEKVRK